MAAPTADALRESNAAFSEAVDEACVKETSVRSTIVSALSTSIRGLSVSQRAVAEQRLNGPSRTPRDSARASSVAALQQ